MLYLQLTSHRSEHNRAREYLCKRIPLQSKSIFGIEMSPGRKNIFILELTDIGLQTFGRCFLIVAAPAGFWFWEEGGEIFGGRPNGVSSGGPPDVGEILENLKRF